MVKVRGAGGGRVSIAGVAAVGPGTGRACSAGCGCTAAAKARGFTWAGYRNLILAAHRALSAPLVWVRDNRTIRLAPELAGFAQENEAWLRICRQPAYTPDLNPVEPSAFCRCSLVAVAVAGLLLAERFSRCCPQPGYRSGCDQG